MLKVIYKEPMLSGEYCKMNELSSEDERLQAVMSGPNEMGIYLEFELPEDSPPNTTRHCWLNKSTFDKYYRKVGEHYYAYESWQMRVIEEAEELDYKIEKLKAYLDTDHGPEVPNLKIQLSIMLSYSQILHVRIEDFEKQL